MFRTRLDWILANIDLPRTMQHWSAQRLSKFLKKKRNLHKVNNRYNKEIKQWFKNHPEIVANYNQMLKDLDAGDLPF